MAKVVLQNLASVLPKRKALEIRSVRDVNLEIGDGEFAVVIGPPRSGKSTLLRLIAGLDELARGEIFIGERKVNDRAPKDRELAMVFRSFALYPHMSARENATFGLKLRKFSKSEIDKRVSEAAAILEMTDSLDRKPAALSKEEQLRTALLRALVRQPKLFLLEDPLAQLDATSRARMRAEIAKLHQRLQVTMIYTTSDANEAMQLGDRAIVLRDGSVEQSDLPAAIYHAPANLFVAGFMGNPPMNLIRGSLKQERDALLFREADEGTIELRVPLAEHEAAAEFVGQPVVLGVRPEHIAVRPSSVAQGKSADTFPALLEVVEPTGAGAILYLQTGVHPLVSLSEATFERREAGRRVRCSIESSKAHFFDPVSTRRIASA